MDKFVIRGGNPLLGTIRVSGAKNAALPAMAAALLTDQPIILENIPQVRDIETERRLLSSMGAEVELGYGRAQHRTTICVGRTPKPEAAYELVKTMRASTLVLGPLVARCGEARVSMPAGCAIGARPIDLHIKGLERLGAEITTEHGYVVARAKRLKGARISFDKITVTGTEDLLMAATLAEGETIMENCAREPEVADLAALLNKMGAKIEGGGRSTIKIEGVEKLHGARHRIIPDRIEAGTFILAGAMTGGDLNVSGLVVEHQSALLQKLEEVGVKIRVTGDSDLNRGRDVHPGRRDDRRRPERQRAGGRASVGAVAETGRGRREDPSHGGFCPRDGRGTVQAGGHEHRGISRVRHRYAGAVHGTDDTGRGYLGCRREYL